MKLQVLVHPSSKRPRVLKDSSGLLHIYVSQPPVDDKANQAVIACLADYFNINKSKVNLVSGQKSKKKLFNVNL